MEIQVLDTGVGMDQDQMATLFVTGAEVSRRGTAGERGHGIGMLQIKAYTDLFGGDVVVESVPGEGTAVKIVLNKATD